MKLYEAMVIVDDRNCAEDYDAVAEHVQGILKKNGADIRKFTKWDERRLAYPVDRHLRGVYLLAYFDIETDKVSQIKRDFGLSDVVLRALITVPSKSAEEALNAPEAEPEQQEASETTGDTPAGEETAEEQPAEESTSEESSPDASNDEGTVDAEKKVDEDAPAKDEAEENTGEDEVADEQEKTAVEADDEKDED